MKKLCVRLTFKTGREHPFDVKVLYGLILEDKNGFITFKTANRISTIAKSCIVSIEETNRVFISNLKQQDGNNNPAQDNSSIKKKFEGEKMEK